MGFILIKKVDNLKFYNQLKDICIKHNINNPIVGEELYNSSAFDLSKQKQPYSSIITSMCQYSGSFQHFKENRREILGFSFAKDPVFLKKKEHEFTKVKQFLTFELFGPSEMTPESLIFLYKERMISNKEF